MTRRLICLAAALGLVACGSGDAGPSEPYAFVGTWECGTTTLSLTSTTYTDGTRTYPIRTVARDGRNYTLGFADGYVIALAAVTETGLTRVSGATGDTVNCRRAG